MHKKGLSPPVIYIADRAKAVILMCYFVLLVLVSVSVLFTPSMCLDDI